jgi:plasmid maintenance system antidote protein VapI
MRWDEAIDKAAAAVGGITALAERLEWNKGSIAGIKAGKKTIPPYRAAQLANLLGESALVWHVSALATQAKSASEQNYWNALADSLALDLANTSTPGTEPMARERRIYDLVQEHSTVDALVVSGAIESFLTDRDGRTGSATDSEILDLAERCCGLTASFMNRLHPSRPTSSQLQQLLFRAISGRDVEHLLSLLQGKSARVVT